MTPRSNIDTDRLAHRIAAHGIKASEPQVRHIARRAQTLGVAPTATSVLIDSTQADVARERAFARVVAALERERMHDLAAA